MKIVNLVLKRCKFNKVDQDFGHRYIAMLWFDDQQTFFEMSSFVTSDPCTVRLAS